MRKRRVVRMQNRDKGEEGIIMNPESSAGIYVTASVKSQCRFIAHNRKMKEEEKTKYTRVNAMKRVSRMNRRAKSFANFFAKLPNEMMDSEDPSTPLLIQVLPYLSTNIIKDSYYNLGGKMGELPAMKKRTVEAAIVRKWGERIWVMRIYACVL